MPASIQHELLPGRVVARVFAHELLSAASGSLPCFSWVTDGLRAFGQQEIVFTLVRPLGAGIEHAPQDPLYFLRAVAKLAQEGRLVSAGGFTEVGAHGMFGRPTIRGVAYETAWPMDGVALPDGCLAAVALVAHEMDAVKRFGALRTLARLGDMHRFFPTAPWCDPARAPIGTPEAQTILAQAAPGHIPGVSVVLVDQLISVRLPRAAQARIAATGLPPPDSGVAFLTVLDASADACLVWWPGQPGPRAISPPGSRGARVSGCFVLFVPQQARDAADPYEDGFVAMLTDASWGRVRQALLSGTEVTIAAAQPSRALAIEWYEPAPPRAAAVPAVSEMRMQLRESQADIEARIGMQAIVAYANAVEGAVQAHFAGPSGQGAVLELDVVLGAGQPPGIRVSSWPESPLAASLSARLAALPTPPLRFGEIAFRGTFQLFGGPTARA